MKLLLWLTLSALIVDQLSGFHQTDYTIVHERIEVLYVNKDWLSDFTLELYHYSRYEKRYRGSVCIKKDIYGIETTASTQAYKYQSNEYRVFPVVYTGNRCSDFNNNIFGTRAFLDNFDHNITISETCFVKKGCYYIKNVYLNDTNLPPFAPRGRYMMAYDFFLNKTITLYKVKAYIEIKPTNPLENVIAG